MPVYSHLASQDTYKLVYHIVHTYEIGYVKIPSMTKIVTDRQAFATGIVEELKKVSWPDRRETIRLTTVVIAISLIIGLYIGIIDVLLAKALAMVTKIK